MRLVDVRTSASRVRSANVRDTELFDVERPLTSTCSPTGSWVRRYRRVDTPASLGSNTTGPSGIPVSEVLKSRQPDLGHDAGAPHPRTLDLDTPTTERHLTTLVARTHRRPLQVAPALRNDIVDLLAHQLLERAQPNAHAQRQQPPFAAPTNAPNASCTRPESKASCTPRARPHHASPQRPVRCHSRRCPLRSLADRRERPQPERARPEGPPSPQSPTGWV